MSIFKKLLGGGDGEKQQTGLAAILAQAQEAIANAQTMQAQVVIVQPDGEVQIKGPTSDFIKKVQCHLCGGAKTIAPKSAYVYCDFCGGLTDYDFQIACKNPGANMPGPAYEQLVRSLQGDILAAQNTGDQEKYRQLQKSLFAKWVELCPNANSPRIKDESYRNALVDYMAEIAVINNFDKKYQEFAQTVATQTKAIQWVGAYPNVKASGATFWPLYHTVREQTSHSFDLIRGAGVVEKHPDGAPESLQKDMTWSMFAQGWIPWLEADDSEKLLVDAHLKGEYVKIENKETSTKHCGGCGGELKTLPGAKMVLCEDCGNKIDVSTAEVNCSNCAGQISLPVAEKRLNCPFCKTEISRMGW